MHVPKSAGTSVHVALRRALAPGTVSPKRQDTSLFCCGFTDIDQLQPEVRSLLVVDSDDIRALSDYGVISGHFSLSTLLRVTSPASVATVLREPRARVLSHYAFWRLSSTLRRSWQGYQALDHAMRPLDEFLAEPLVAAATDNLVCRMLLGQEPRIPAIDFIAPSDIEAVAADAIEVLDTLGYVGVLERGDSLWGGLSSFFGVRLEPISENATTSQDETYNVPAGQNSITAHTLDVLAARTAADAIVYRHAFLAAGCAPEDANRARNSAFLAELFRIGDLTGTSATESRARGRAIEKLKHEAESQAARLVSQEAQLHRKDAELRRVGEVLHEARQDLVQLEDQLRWHRAWLDGLQRSVSWRLTAPLRACKQALMRTRRRSGTD